MKKRSKRKQKENFKEIIKLRNLILVFQVIILLLSAIWGVAVSEILLGLTLLAMSYNSQRQYGNNIMILVYILFGILLIFFGIADINGYHYL